MIIKRSMLLFGSMLAQRLRAWVAIQEVLGSNPVQSRLISIHTNIYAKIYIKII